MTIFPLAPIAFDLGSSNLETRERHKKKSYRQTENTYICIPVQREIFAKKKVIGT